MPPIDEGLSADPLVRLTATLGADPAYHMLQRLRSRLVAIMVADDPMTVGEGATPAELGHRIGGLAGLLGFAELAESWLAVELDGVSRMPAARARTRATIDLLDTLLTPAQDRPLP